MKQQKKPQKGEWIQIKGIEINKWGSNQTYYERPCIGDVWTFRNLQSKNQVDALNDRYHDWRVKDLRGKPRWKFGELVEDRAEAKAETIEKANVKKNIKSKAMAWAAIKIRYADRDLVLDEGLFSSETPTRALTPRSSPYRRAFSPRAIGAPWTKSREISSP